MLFGFKKISFTDDTEMGKGNFLLFPSSTLILGVPVSYLLSPPPLNKKKTRRCFIPFHSTSGSEASQVLLLSCLPVSMERLSARVHVHTLSYLHTALFVQCADISELIEL